MPLRSASSKPPSINGAQQATSSWTYGKASASDVIDWAGGQARKRFLEFFTATIRNENTRMAYARAVGAFFRWCESYRLELIDIEPIHVAAYIERHPGAPPTVKQHLAAIRMLFDWLVTGQILPINPAAAVRGPKHVVTVGRTPVLAADEARQLLDSIDTSSIAMVGPPPPPPIVKLPGAS